MASKFPRSQSSRAIMGCAGQVQSLEASPRKLQGLKYLLPTAAHLQESSRVYAKAGATQYQAEGRLIGIHD